MFFKTSLLFFVFFNSLFADTIFDKASQKYNINKKILASIAMHESKFEPSIVGVNIGSNKKKIEILAKYLKAIGCKHSIYRHRAHIYLKDDTNAKIVFFVLNRLKMDYDVGIMQINKYNIDAMHLDPIELINNVYYNIDIGAKVYDTCRNVYGNNLELVFECYNKGFDRKKYNYKYSNNIITNYKKLFM